jgi:hypothetical protein
VRPKLTLPASLAGGAGARPDHPITGPSESVATLDRGPRLEDHVTLSELGRIDEAF